MDSRLDWPRFGSEPCEQCSRFGSAESRYQLCQLSSFLIGDSHGIIAERVKILLPNKLEKKSVDKLQP